VVVVLGIHAVEFECRTRTVARVGVMVEDCAVVDILDARAGGVETGIVWLRAVNRSVLSLVQRVRTDVRVRVGRSA
jgi:hypothetical protein